MAKFAIVTEHRVGSPSLDNWTGLTPLARHEFICWIEDAKQDKTRERRIHRTQEELEAGRPPLRIRPTIGFDGSPGED